MTRRSPVLVRAALAAMLALAAGVVVGAPVQGRGRHKPAIDPNPLVFVHGGAGSGQQYETPAKRFASNGYKAESIYVFEYDSTFSRNTRDEVYAALDRKIDEVRGKSGREKVDLAAHSLGTAISHAYLASPERAARVANYVNYDGASSQAPPGGVRTLAVWGQGADTRTIVGAENVKFDQSHTQVVTSAESFAAVYKFLTGVDARTTEIVPSRGHHVNVAGKVAIFPQNYAPEGATLDVHVVDGRTGARLSPKPHKSFTIGADGAFGFTAQKGAHYEFVISREGNPSQHHFYTEPFVRDDLLVRLLTGEPGAGVGALVEVSDKHSALTITRNKEWWGDQTDRNDVLEIEGTNVINAAIAPINKRAIAVFAFDKGSDGTTNLAAPIPDISAQIFLTAVDLYVPAADQPATSRQGHGRGHGKGDGKGQRVDRTITIKVTARGEGGATQVINVPNWKSSEHRISVLVNEYA